MEIQKVAVVCRYFSSLRLRKTQPSHVVAMQRTVKKCTEIYTARVQLLFCSLNIFLGGNAFAAVSVVVIA